VRLGSLPSMPEKKKKKKKEKKQENYRAQVTQYRIFSKDVFANANREKGLFASNVNMGEPGRTNERPNRKYFSRANHEKGGGGIRLGNPDAGKGKRGKTP